MNKERKMKEKNEGEKIWSIRETCEKKTKKKGGKWTPTPCKLVTVTGTQQQYTQGGGVIVLTLDLVLLQAE